MLAKVGQRHRTDPFAICSEVHCQAYTGIEKVDARIREAVQATRGEVLVGGEGRLIDAFYHAVSGGHTENNENAWQMPAQTALRGRADLVPGAADPLAGGPTEAAIQALLDGEDKSWAAASGLNRQALRWKATCSPAELSRSLGAFGITGAPRSIAVMQRGVSGRAIELEIVLLDGTRRRLRGELRIRRALGGLRSSLFLIEAGPNGADGAPASFTFSGAGYGHGVGMDQTGAVGRARRGQSYREILSHYYSGTSLVRIY
jgi:SpoIID/LytB domain protein